MKLPSATTRAALLLCTALAAASPGSRANPEPNQDDAVQQAIRAFNESRRSGENEVTVVLPPAEPPTDLQPITGEEEPPPAPAETPEPESPQEDSPSTEPTPTSPAAEADGPGVRVESWNDVAGMPVPANIRLTAPFPAKPLRPAPAGWRIDRSAEAPAFLQEVELAPGKRLALSIQPHVLVPEADGIEVFSIQEPGFQPDQGYQQQQTVGAILAQTILKLDEEAKKLNHALEELQQILVALPQDPTPAPANPTSP